MEKQEKAAQTITFVEVEKVEGKARVAAEYVRGVLNAMEIDAELSVARTENGVVLRLTGDGLGVIFSFLTSLLVSFVSMRQTADMSGNAAAAAGMSKSMMIMMPLMSAWISFVVPAGLGVYWIISNILMAVQTYLLNKFMNPKELAEKARKEAEERREAERQAKIEAKKRARERGETDIEQALSQKEINRLKLAAARKRDAEKYGETYAEVTDDDLKS